MELACLSSQEQVAQQRQQLLGRLGLPAQGKVGGPWLPWLPLSLHGPSQCRALWSEVEQLIEDSDFVAPTQPAAVVSKPIPPPKVLSP